MLKASLLGLLAVVLGLDETAAVPLGVVAVLGLAWLEAR